MCPRTHFLTAFGLMFGLTPSSTPAQQTVSTFDPLSSSAYAANAGGVAFRYGADIPAKGVSFGERVCAGLAYGANVGWIDFGSGLPADGIAYRNDGSDFGVNHDGLGNLSGFAWGANIGWVRFDWATPAGPLSPQVDLLTGQLSGLAWSGNIGWIDLSALRAVSMACTDTDNDGIGDEWEYLWFLGLSVVNASTDFDGDGFGDVAEYIAATDPRHDQRFPMLVSIDLDRAAGTLTSVFTSSPQRHYRLRTSTDLVQWFDSGLGVFAPDAGTLTSRVIPASSTTERQFLRVDALKPLQPNPPP